MRPRRGMHLKSLASTIALALLLYPFASAQEPVPPQATRDQPPQGHSTNTTAPPAANQSSGDPIPDSPSTVLARANQMQATTPNSAPADNNPSAGPDPTQAQQSDSANAAPAQGRQVSPQPNNQFPNQPSQTSTQPSAQSQQQQQTPHEPVGTAAAESLEVTGVAASRPAGAAVAPAKQRRARSILIKVGALIGAGVAIGTTMALSQGSPSKPPGSH